MRYSKNKVLTVSNIEWTGQTWNPIVGCSKVSQGCRNCYAINQAYRNWAIGEKMPEEKRGRLVYYEGLTGKHGDRVEWTGEVKFVPEALEIPLKRKKPETYFVNSMSDLFHESVEYKWLAKILEVCSQTPQHTYQVLTKRPERMKQLMREFYGATGLKPLSNVWLGVTVENQKAANERIGHLLKTPAAVRFLSCEPLLEQVILHEEYLHCLDWVIVGGESGKNCRPCDQDWIQSIVDQCIETKTPVFVKQLGGYPDKRHDFEKFPESLKYRQMPMK